MEKLTKKLRFFVVKEPPEGLVHKVIRLLEGIRDFKNEVSEDFNDNLYEYLSLKVKDYITFARAKFQEKIKEKVSSHFDYQALETVYLNYQRREEDYFNHIKFNPIIIKFGNHDRRDSRKKSCGTDVNVFYSDTFVIRCLNYILKIGNPPKKWYYEHLNEVTEEYESSLTRSDRKCYTERNSYTVIQALCRKSYARERLKMMSIADKEYLDTLENPTPKNKDMKFRIAMCIFINKAGFDRVWQLVESRRVRMYSVSRHPIVYKGLGTRGRSRFTVFFDKVPNCNQKNLYNFHLSWPGEKNGLTIPVKYSPSYHGKLEEYQDKGRNFSYQIKIDRKRRIVIGYCIDAVQDEIEIDTDNFCKAVGIDVNTSSNLLACSDGKLYPEEGMEKLDSLLKQVSEMMARTDRLKSEYDNYTIGKKRKRKELALYERLRKEIEFIIARVCKSLVAVGRTHVVMEHLLNTFGKQSFRYKKFNNLNMNRILQAVGLSSLKHTLARVGQKYGIIVSTVHSAYTSQMCPVCGAITRANRKTRAHFKCVNCQLEANADRVAAVNIKMRFFDEFLRSTLCTHDHDCNWIAKNLNKDAVLSILQIYKCKIENGDPYTVKLKLAVLKDSFLEQLYRFSLEVDKEGRWRITFQRKPPKSSTKSHVERPSDSA